LIEIAWEGIDGIKIIKQWKEMMKPKKVKEKEF